MEPLFLIIGLILLVALVYYFYDKNKADVKNNEIPTNTNTNTVTNVPLTPTTVIPTNTNTNTNVPLTPTIVTPTNTVTNVPLTPTIVTPTSGTLYIKNLGSPSCNVASCNAAMKKYIFDSNGSKGFGGSSITFPDCKYCPNRYYYYYGPNSFGYHDGITRGNTTTFADSYNKLAIQQGTTSDIYPTPVAGTTYNICYMDSCNARMQYLASKNIGFEDSLTSASDCKNCPSRGFRPTGFQTTIDGKTWIANNDLNTALNKIMFKI